VHNALPPVVGKVRCSLDETPNLTGTHRVGAWCSIADTPMRMLAGSAACLTGRRG
jgi:hypothetical protein